MVVPKQHYATSSLVIGYALCSSLLDVINKFAITKFNYPGLLTALGVWVLGKLGFLSHDPFMWETAKKFLPIAVVFYLAIFTKTNLLCHANVDTFIVFRSLTPLLVVVSGRHHQPPPVQTSLAVPSLMNEKTIRLPTMRARREKAMEIFRSGNDGVGKMMP
ncbi:hypothetical protein R6Q57_016082 [Mikania cordata]